MNRLLLIPLFLSACSPGSARTTAPAESGQTPTTIAGYEPKRPIGQVRAAVRAEAQRLYGEECGTVVLPDRAFEPIEITGGGHPEYAVLFARGICSGDGGSGRWQGTGGVLVQIWLASGGPPRLLLEHSMHGFTPVPRGLLSLQHGGFCPDGAGPGICLVQHEWNDKDRTLDVVNRRLFDHRNPGTPPRMSFEYEAISR